MLKVDAPTKTTSQPHDDCPRVGSADDGRPEGPSNAGRNRSGEQAVRPISEGNCPPGGDALAIYRSSA